MLGSSLVFCTLLGPEGPGACLLCGGGGSLLLGLLLLPAGLVGGGGGYRPYFENYTVDASIFEMSNHLVR